MYKAYTIQKGDNLTTLAKKFNTTIEELASVNQLDDPDRIFAGKQLLVPDVKLQRQQMRRPSGTSITNEKLRQMMPIDPRQDAIQSVAPELMALGGPGGGMLAGGILAKVAAAMPQAMKAGRVASVPKGWNNVLPIGNNASFNTGMAKAMIPAPAMMRRNPGRVMSEMGAEAIKRDPKFFIGKGASPEVNALEELLERIRFGDI